MKTAKQDKRKLIEDKSTGSMERQKKFDNLVNTRLKMAKDQSLDSLIHHAAANTLNECQQLTGNLRPFEA